MTNKWFRTAVLCRCDAVRHQNKYSNEFKHWFIDVQSRHSSASVFVLFGARVRTFTPSESHFRNGEKNVYNICLIYCYPISTQSYQLHSKHLTTVRFEDGNVTLNDLFRFHFVSSHHFFFFFHSPRPTISPFVACDAYVSIVSATGCRAMLCIVKIITITIYSERYATTKMLSKAPRWFHYRVTFVFEAHAIRLELDIIVSVRTTCTEHTHLTHAQPEYK